MAEVSLETVTALWNTTRGYSWESVRSGLVTLFNRGTIDQTEYGSMLSAINRLERIGDAFPMSAYEMYKNMNYYL